MDFYSLEKYQEDGIIVFTIVAIVISAKLYLYFLAFAAIAIWVTHTHIHTFLALVNMTIFKCGKGSTHIDYLSGTQDMDILFSKVSSYLRKNPIILQYILLCSSQHYNITFIHAYLILRQMIQSLDVNLRMFCCIRDAALGLITGLKKWIPIRWKLARRIDRDSIDCCENPWQNQYWTCC